jgi:hypothetical protein
LLQLVVQHLFSASRTRQSATRGAFETIFGIYVIVEGQRGFSVAPISARELKDVSQVRCDLESEALRRAIAHLKLYRRVVLGRLCRKGLPEFLPKSLSNDALIKLDSTREFLSPFKAQSTGFG